MHEPSLIPVRPRPSLAALLLGVAALLLTADARADEVVLKSGKIRKGDVVSEDARFIVLESPLGRIRIPATEVVEIRRDESDGGVGERTELPTVPPATDTPAADTPDADRPRISRPRIARPTTSRPEDETEDEIPDETENEETAEHMAPVADAGDDSSAPSDRLRRLRASRVVRRTTAPDPDVEKTPDEPRTESTIGGRVLGKVPKGTELIVFQPPRPFEPAPGAIELGKRTLATMEMAGSASAWLKTAGADGEQRIAIRLADVKRHIEVTSPESRARLFEGINAGDWVRIQTTSGVVIQGRLDALGNGVVQLATVDRERGTVKTPVGIDAIVSVDGVIRDSAAELALTDIDAGELLAVTFWPTGDHIMGRHVEGAASVLSLDLDDDGASDTTVLREGPLAEVRRVPARHRELAVKLRPGNVVRVTYRDDYPDAAVRRTTLGSIEALTAFALAIRDGEEAVIVPFDGVSDLVLIEDDPVEEIARWNEHMPRSVAAEELAILPGMTAQEAAQIPKEDGVSTVSDGRMITHVFVSAPFSGEALGVRIGEPVSQATRRSPLRFDTSIIPRVIEGAPPEPRQLVSESVEGLRVVLLADGLGVVTSIEISLAE